MRIASRFGAVVHLDGILLALLIGSLGINVYLGVARHRSGVSAPSRPELIAEGTQAPSFEGTDVKGHPVTLVYSRDRRNTLLYVFSPTCHWCERNVANIRAVINARSDIHVVGINIGPAMDITSASRQPFADILTPTRATAQAYRFSGTPATILISPSGKILKTWAGAYAGPIGTDVSKVLAVSLPGLLDEPPVQRAGG